MNANQIGGSQKCGSYNISFENYGNRRIMNEILSPQCIYFSIKWKIEIQRLNANLNCNLKWFLFYLNVNDNSFVEQNAKPFPIFAQFPII